MRYVRQFLSARIKGGWGNWRVIKLCVFPGKKKKMGQRFGGGLCHEDGKFQSPERQILSAYSPTPFPRKLVLMRTYSSPGLVCLWSEGGKLSLSLSLYFLFFLWKFDLFSFVYRERDPRSSVDFRASKKRVGCYVIIFDGKKNSFPRPGREVGWKVFSLLKYNWILNFNRT